MSCFRDSSADFGADDTPSRQGYDEDMSRSPVYSLCVPNHGLWLLSGTESGNINVQTVRHNEGTRIHTLRGHKSAVSVLHLAPDERSVLSGSWDKTILDWDLNVGQIKRSFTGSGGQVSAIEPRPLSKLAVPEESGLSNLLNGTFTSNNNARPKAIGGLTNGATGDDLFGDDLPTKSGLHDAPDEQDDDMNSLFGDDEADGGGMEPPMQLGDDEDDEFSRAIASGLQQPDEEDAPGDVDMADSSGPVQPPETAVAETSAADQPTTEIPQTLVNGEKVEETTQANGLPHSDDTETRANGASTDLDVGPASETTFLDACQDGTIRVWDRRQHNPIARITPPRGTPPWCMSACWSPDGNMIYAGRRNNSVEEYSLHKGLREPSRSFKFPAGSGPVSAVRTMPNGKHLIWYVSSSAPGCTSTDVKTVRPMIFCDFTISKHNQHRVIRLFRFSSFLVTGQVSFLNYISIRVPRFLSLLLGIGVGRARALKFYWATKSAAYNEIGDAVQLMVVTGRLGHLVFAKYGCLLENEGIPIMIWRWVSFGSGTNLRSSSNGKGNHYFFKGAYDLESHSRYCHSTTCSKRGRTFPEIASLYPCAVPGHFLVHHSPGFDWSLGDHSYAQLPE